MRGNEAGAEQRNELHRCRILRRCRTSRQAILKNTRVDRETFPECQRSLKTTAMTLFARNETFIGKTETVSSAGKRATARPIVLCA